MSSRRKVLLVDDDPAHLDILEAILGSDHDVSAVTGGEEALRFVRAERPHIVLLDILMPDLNGYEVCRRLKALPETADIPVIFVTSRDADEDEARGLEYGAQDYITKPFCPAVVRARVRNHLLLAEQRERLEKSISLLEHEKELLQQKAELGIQAGGLAHDMANILTVLEVLRYIPRERPGTDEEWADVLAAVDMSVESMDVGAGICKGFTSYLRNVGEPAEDCSLSDLLQVLGMYRKRYKGALTQHVQPAMPPVRCKAWQVRRVFVNLFTNAMQAVEQAASPEIALRLWHDAQGAHFSITDNGAGILPEHLPRIFEESFTTKPAGTGLGLYMARQIMDSHGGTIAVDSQPGKGTTFTLTFPMPEKRA